MRAIIGVSVDTELALKAERQAEKRKMSRSDLVAEALRAYLQNDEEAETELNVRRDERPKAR